VSAVFSLYSHYPTTTLGLIYPQLLDKKMFPHEEIHVCCTKELDGIGHQFPSKVIPEIGTGLL
jgi:hypothetical protein